ncbi:hypothetical protein LF25067_00996 [Limosilactobacillus fermentum]|nr:hypothetical protein LF25067_00996 [Limosilactobacillus fermentum]
MTIPTVTLNNGLKMLQLGFGRPPIEMPSKPLPWQLKMATP